MYDMFVAGMLKTGESYSSGARCELQEELGLADPQPSFLFKHRYDGPGIPAFKGVFEVVCLEPIRPEEDEIAWGQFMLEGALLEKMSEWEFIPDAVEIFQRYLVDRSPD